MWRAFFLAVGITCCIIGAECLVIEKAVLAARHESTPGVVRSLDAGGRHRELKPTEWAPWSLLSAGAVTILYSFTIPRRVKD
jgi:hypothetical protein